MDEGAKMYELQKVDLTWAKVRRRLVDIQQALGESKELRDALRAGGADRSRASLVAGEATGRRVGVPLAGRSHRRRGQTAHERRHPHPQRAGGPAGQRGIPSTPARQRRGRSSGSPDARGRTQGAGRGAAQRRHRPRRRMAKRSGNAARRRSQDEAQLCAAQAKARRALPRPCRPPCWRSTKICASGAAASRLRL